MARLAASWALLLSVQTTALLHAPNSPTLLPASAGARRGTMLRPRHDGGRSRGRRASERWPKLRSAAAEEGEELEGEGGGEGGAEGGGESTGAVAPEAPSTAPLRRYLLLRHGQTDMNAAGIIQGSSDVSR